jgi:hypothetical protein
MHLLVFYYQIYIKFKVFMAMKFYVVIWVLNFRRLVSPYQHFAGRNCYKTSPTLKNECSVSLENAWTHLLDYKLNMLAEVVVLLTCVPEVPK